MIKMWARIKTSRIYILVATVVTAVVGAVLWVLTALERIDVVHSWGPWIYGNIKWLVVQSWFLPISLFLILAFAVWYERQQRIRRDATFVTRSEIPSEVSQLVQNELKPVNDIAHTRENSNNHAESSCI
jgi:hypothetical protein